MHRILVMAALLSGCGASSPSVHSSPSSEARGGAASGSSAARLPIEPASDLLEPVEPARPAVATRLGGGRVVTGASRHRLVLFTFDDGPHARHTRQVLDTLEASGIRAVFFVVPGRVARGGPHAEEEAALIREIAARGHVVGSHTQDHQHLTELDDAGLIEQVVHAEETLASVLGERPFLFRPPGGARSDASDALLRERGYTQVLWTLVTGDFLTTDPDEVVSIFRRSVRGRERRGVPGGVVLLHDTHSWTAQALPRLIAYLEARNCELFEAGEELYDMSPDPRWFVVPSDGAAGDEAPLVEPPSDEWQERQRTLRASAAEHCR